MMISKVSAYVVVAALGVLLTMAGDAQQADPGVLLRAAIEKEDVAGDLEGAMALYRQIIAANGKNRAVTARAMLRLAGCYEKLGQTEARKLYERLVAEYSDQTQEAASARARLAALAKSVAPQKPTFRKISIPSKRSTDGTGKLSPDGQTLAFIADRSLWTVPVHGKSDPNIAGAPTRLTEPMYAWDTANICIEWSVDGKWIGFLVEAPQRDKPTFEELYLVPAAGGTPRRVPITWDNWAGYAYTLRYALSAGGEMLHFAAGLTLDDLRIYSMPTRGGDRRPVTAPITREPALSPDGSRIAYVKGDKGSGDQPLTKEVWVASVDGTATQLVYRLRDEAPGAWVRGPIWSPDGKMLAFLVCAKGNVFDRVFVLPLGGREGAATEPARFVLPRWTPDILAGWTKDHRIGVLIPTEERLALYAVPAAGGRAVQLTPKTGSLPAWTPDSKQIYFWGGHTRERGALEVVPAEGGPVEGRPLDPAYERWHPSYPPGGGSISPDGQFFCVHAYATASADGTQPAIEQGIFILSTRGGRPARLTTGDDIEPKWSPDGAGIAFVHRDPTTRTRNIFILPPGGGTPRQVTTGADSVGGGSLAWSPDGKAIAFFDRDRQLRIVPSGGGTSRIVTKVTGSVSGLAWSPDGTTFAYVLGGELWGIPAAGGTPTRVETGLEARLGKIAWSPDGKRIAFEATTGGEHEFWLMEDFIHLVKAVR